MKINSQFLSAMLLISGTCVGGGMLALPIDTGIYGLVPSLVFMLICWGFMTMTALYLVEVNLWMEEGVHIMTMASRLLGRFGKYLSLLLFLFMGYASLIAYVNGGGRLIENLIADLFQIPIHHWQGAVIFILLFGSCLFLGAKFLGRINGILVVGMIASYIGVIVLGVSEINPLYAMRQHWSLAFSVLPILLTIFSFQMIIPSVTPYLNRDPKQCKWAVILGTLIPLIVYTIWQIIVLGSIPLEGENALLHAKEQGYPATEPIRAIVKNPWLIKYSDFFAFFAIVTSFLGISLGLYDFLADSLKLVKKGVRKLFLGLIVLVPSFSLAVLFPRAFVLALEITGGFGDALLNGALPVLMIYSGRYHQKIQGPYTVWGGKPMACGVFVFALGVVVIQVKNIFHW